MENKKFNIFALFLIIVMAIFTVYTSVNDKDAKDGRDGLSAYELAVSNGEFTGTELEYLLSLHGQDGSNITLEHLYNAYLKANNKTASDETYLEFITSYFDDLILNDKTQMTLVEAATQTALRSTVDICYADYMETPIIEVSESGNNYIIDTSINETYASVSLSAGSGVIYQIGSDTAYIITNYHVLYVDNYSNDSNYRVYRNTNSKTGQETYFTATYDESKIKTTTKYDQFYGFVSYNYIAKSDIEMAPINTHFMETYDVYLYGYQSSEYAISATFVGGSADNDIAVLKIDKNSTNKNNELIFNGVYKAADLGDSSDVNTGRTVIAVGNPLIPNIEEQTPSTVKEYVEELEQYYVDALCLTSTSGEISNVSEDRDFESLIEPGESVRMRLLRVSAAINAGNSGGGLYDVTGRLVGIVNGKIVSEQYDNVGYAIPINIATRVADRVIAQCEGVSGKTRIEAVTADSLGITVRDGNKKTNFDVEWTLENNVIVSALSATKSAYLAGMTEDNIIKSIEIAGKIYDVNFSYDLNDLLLIVDKNDSATHTIKFNIQYVVENQITNKQITINLTQNDFVEII